MEQAGPKVRAGRGKNIYPKQLGCFSEATQQKERLPGTLFSVKQKVCFQEVASGISQLQTDNLEGGARRTQLIASGL